MASGITHLLLTKKLQDELSDGMLKDILAYASDALIVGSVAPDLPYASIVDDDLFFTTESDQADRFHYTKTNQIPLKSLEWLKQKRDTLDPAIHYQLFAFYIGYISHVIADGIIHPYVRDKVGEYHKNQAAHRSLEMQLDVLVMREFNSYSGTKMELMFANLHDELKNFNRLEGKDAILESFSSLIEEVYDRTYSSQKINGWIKGLHRMFSIAEGEYPSFYRNLSVNSFTYRKQKDIDDASVLILTKPDDQEENFLKREQISFFDDCIPQYYKCMQGLAEKAFAFVFDNGTKLNEKDIPLINLDTGRLLSNDVLNAIPVFWKK